MFASSTGLEWRPSCCQCELFHQFLQRADAAGQRHESVGMFEHQALAFVHVGRDDHFLNALESVFPDGQKVGYDPRHRAAVIEHGGGHGAHQADRAAAIDKADAAFGQGLAQCLGSFDEAGICAGAGATIDADGLDLVHIGHVALQRKSRQALMESPYQMKSIRRCPQIIKEFGSGKGVPDGQTLYMTCGMQKNLKNRAPNRRAMSCRA